VKFFIVISSSARAGRFIRSVKSFVRNNYFVMKKPIKTSMLEYSKIIMKKMSFDKRLFRKEYKKTFNYLTRTEQQSLKEWLQNG